MSKRNILSVNFSILNYYGDIGTFFVNKICEEKFTSLYECAMEKNFSFDLSFSSVFSF
jgi:hypothetical protein